MKAIQNMLLMVLVALMSVNLQSCNDDDPISKYSFDVQVADKGDMPDDVFNEYQKTVDEIKSGVDLPSVIVDLNTAKKAVDKAADEVRSKLEDKVKAGNPYKFAFALILKNSSNEEAYRRTIYVDGTSVTVK